MFSISIFIALSFQTTSELSFIVQIWSVGGSVAPAILSLNLGLKCVHWVCTGVGLTLTDTELKLSLPNKSESNIPSPAHIKITTA